MKKLSLCYVSLLALCLSHGVGLAQNAPKSGGEAAPAGEEETKKLPAPPKPAGGTMKANPGEAEKPAPAQKPAPKPSAEPQPKPEGQAQPKPEGQAQPKPEQTQAPAQKPAASAQPTKPGGQARPAPKITADQRTRIQETIKTINVRPVTVDFSINVGVAVPRTVVIQPLPPEIITYVPDYEGYDFFLVPGEIVIVDPDSLEVVAVIPL